MLSMLTRNHQYLITMRDCVKLYSTEGRIVKEFALDPGFDHGFVGNYIFISSNEILACGGRHSNACHNSATIIYSVEKESNRSVSDMNHARSRHAIAWYQSRVYVFGGYGDPVSEFYTVS